MPEEIQGPLQISRKNQARKEVIVAVFFCANISTAKLILRRLESYDGVNKVESLIRTSITINQDWLKSELDKRISSQKYLTPSSAFAAET